MAELLAVTQNNIFTQHTYGGRTTLAVNTANTWAATRFIAPAALTLDYVVIGVSAVAGTVTGIGIIRIETDDGTGKPSGTLVTGAAQETFTPTTGTSGQKITLSNKPALSATTLYHVVIKNGDGTPGTNNFTLVVSFGSISVYPFLHNTTTTATWAAPSPTAAPCMHFGFTDGTEVAPGPCSGATGPLAPVVYGTGGTARQVRLRYQFSTGIKLGGFYCATTGRTGTSGDFVLTVYDSSNNVLGTATIPQNGLHTTASRGAVFLFGSPIYIGANTEVRFVFTATAGDASNNVNFGNGFLTQPGYQTLLQLGNGLIAFEASTNGGSTWSNAQGIANGIVNASPIYTSFGDIDGFGTLAQDSTTTDGGSGSSLRMASLRTAQEFVFKRRYLASATASKTFTAKLRRSSTDIPTTFAIRLVRSGTVLATLTADSNANDTFYQYSSGSLSLTLGDVIEIRYVVQLAGGNTNGYGWFDTESWT